MRRLAIDTESLIMALEAHPVGGTYYLDRKSGEVVHAVHLAPDGEPDRYFSIEPFPPAVGKEVRLDFIESLKDGEARLLLNEAVQRNRPFQRFDDVLKSYPQLRAQWAEYHRRVFRKLAKEWLKSEEIRAELVEPARAAHGS